MTNKMRDYFESSPQFRGMDFTRSSTHPDYYESSYANGAWDGWKASRESLVVAWPDQHTFTAPDVAGAAILDCMTAYGKALGLKVKP